MGKPKQYFPVPITQGWLDSTGREWQKRLRLDEWVIDYRVVSREDSNGNYGYNSSVTRRKAAHICVRDSDTQDPGDISIFDPEVTVVHELLHCHLNTLNIDRELVLQFEFVIEALSEALVAAKRGALTMDHFTHNVLSPLEISRAKEHA